MYGRIGAVGHHVSFVMEAKPSAGRILMTHRQQKDVEYAKSKEIRRYVIWRNKRAPNFPHAL
jgi:hypothetical protein